MTGEVLDDDEERHDTLQSLLDSEADLGSGAKPGDFPTLPRDGYAAFLRGLLDRMEISLADDAEIDRSAECQVNALRAPLPTSVRVRAAYGPAGSRLDHRRLAKPACHS